MPSRMGFWRRLWSSPRAMSREAVSAESTMKLRVGVRGAGEGGGGGEVHDRVDAAAIALPHGAESRLAAEVPAAGREVSR